MSGVNSVVTVFQNLFSNHGSTFLNIVLVVSTIGGQSIIRKLTFACPCAYPLNIVHSLVFMEHASQLAERNARAFFNQKDWTKRDWDWVSGVAEINNPMFARLRLIAAEKTKTTMYTPLQLWNDHKFGLGHVVAI
ncbi:hypothetical protein GCK32_013602 [Trichostrongylus colubriformis]|uniref:Uncharacterized protein n=1 Tax=Trichostrongylus colubriformis TaxID=6319 RepID=A0AAN8FEE7_TRICO